MRGTRCSSVTYSFHGFLFTLVHYSIDISKMLRPSMQIYLKKLSRG